jgi:hypothetical protein
VQAIAKQYYALLAPTCARHGHRASAQALRDLAQLSGKLQQFQIHLSPSPASRSFATLG